MGVVKYNFPCVRKSLFVITLRPHLHRCHSQSSSTPQYGIPSMNLSQSLPSSGSGGPLHIAPDVITASKPNHLDLGVLISKTPPWAFSSLLRRRFSRKGSRTGCILAHESRHYAHFQFSLNSAHLECTI